MVRFALALALLAHGIGQRLGLLQGFRAADLSV
jgi:hypothetical protein